MAKTPSEKLHHLIRSLTPAEKRYFRLFVRGRSDSERKYLQLFDAMAAQASPDDERLKALIYRDKPQEGKKYSELKAYLYDLILRSLQGFDEQHSIDYRLNHYLQSVSVLFKRGHYDDCEQLLHKALRLAREYERFAQQLEIIRWKKQLAYTRMDVDYLHKYLEQLHLEEAQALVQWQNESDYRKVFFQVYTTIKREAQHRGEDRLARLRLLMQSEPFREADQAISHRARILYYRTLNLYHYAALEHDSFYESGRQLIALLESKPYFLQEGLSDYIAAISNMIIACGLLHRYDEVRACLLKLRSLEPQTEDDRRKIHRQYYSGMLVLCIFTGEFAEGRREMERCQAEAARFGPHEYVTASFFFQFCCICFGCGDYDGALFHLNQWLSQPRSVEREDLQSVARMLSLIMHYEMGNEQLLESLLRSATRFLQKKNRLFELEQRFIHFLAELVRLPGAREKRLAFQNLRSDLEGSELAAGMRVFVQTFDLEAWLDSKITGQTFAETVRTKWQREKPTAFRAD